jgi:hypothetical protein
MAKSVKNTDPTHKSIQRLLPGLLNGITEVYKDRPDLILAAWPQVIGEKLAPMTSAVSFEEGLLVVKVKNSTLYSLLSQHERGRLLQCLRKKFPSVVIRNIIFRMG